MKLIIDMNLSPRWSEILRLSGFEAAHWSTMGAGDATDAQIMEYARRHDAVVLTHDLDFGAILAVTQGSKPSVVQIRANNVSPEAIGEPVVSALRLMADELAEGALITIDPERTRLRMLPLPRARSSS